MQLDKQLILFRYILRQLGYRAFEDLRDDYNGQTLNITSTGYTSFAARLMMNPGKELDDRLIQQYDEAIQIHISAFILSVTPLQEVRKKWGEGTTIEQFAENKVLFTDSDKAYLAKIFENM